MSIVWRSARVKEKKERSKVLSTELPLKPLSIICFEDLVMSSKKQRYFTKKEDTPKTKKAKTSQPPGLVQTRCIKQNCTIPIESLRAICKKEPVITHGSQNAATDLEKKIVKKLEDKLIKKLEGDSPSDNDSLVCFSPS